MDGNGRWASSRFMPRVVGHRKGADVLRMVIKESLRHRIPYLSVFAFSSENWSRPADEVAYLMQLFLNLLQKESPLFMEQNIRLVVSGDKSRFSTSLRDKIEEVELLTKDNQALCLTIAANYGGRWDIVQAVNQLLVSGQDSVDEVVFAKYLAFSHAPDPDLLIRTGGDCRVSNFLLWQLAYAELFFFDCFWPDFTESDFEKALLGFSQRERRFGQVMST